MRSEDHQQRESESRIEQPVTGVSPTGHPYEYPENIPSGIPAGPPKSETDSNHDEDNGGKTGTEHKENNRSGSTRRITDVSSITDNINEDGLTTIIDSVIADSKADWRVDLKWDDAHETTTFLFRQPGGDRSFAIRNKGGNYYVHDCAGSEPTLKNSNKTKQCQTFTTAICSILGALDWGTLPPKEPEIWEYEGYDEEESFGSYLSGNDRESCGGHRFECGDAGYTIRIESRATDQKRCAGKEKTQTGASSEPGSTTVADLEVLTWEEPGAERCRYQRTFSGQRGAFNHLFDLVANELSNQIATY